MADPVKTLRWLGENCPKWAALVRSCLRDDHALRIILYLDEITPGNPFNLDHRRSVMASNACALRGAFFEDPRAILGVGGRAPRARPSRA